VREPSWTCFRSLSLRLEVLQRAAAYDDAEEVEC
jgi:hypothetical protein